MIQDFQLSSVAHFLSGAVGKLRSSWASQGSYLWDFIKNSINEDQQTKKKQPTKQQKRGVLSENPRIVWVEMDL